MGVLTITFPAWFDLHSDPVIRQNPSAVTVYAELLQIERILYEPREVKAWHLAERVGMRKQTVLRALDLLISRGYLLDHGRGDNNVRRLSIVTTRTVPAS